MFSVDISPCPVLSAVLARGDESPLHNNNQYTNLGTKLYTM